MCWNPPEGHAEIKGSLSRGLANKVVGQMVYHQEKGPRLRFTGGSMEVL